MTPWHDIHQRAVRRGLSFDDAAYVANHWGRPIGSARPDEPADALTLCAWGAAAGSAEHWRPFAIKRREAKRA